MKNIKMESQQNTLEKVSQFELSVIIPIKITPDRYEIFDRLTFSYQEQAKNVEYIVVDDGSPIEYAILLEKICLDLGYRYVSVKNSISSVFNLARARNIGTQVALGKYVLFLDVDLLTYSTFYDDLFTEIRLFNIEHNSDLFLMIPVIYFNKKGLEEYHKQTKNLKKHFSSKIMIEGKFDLIEKYSYGTSCILVDRLYYLSIGGQDERYEGWGYEDYDFTIKMITLASLFQRPANYESMKGNFMTIKKYFGWKAEYRLYGLWMARKGIYLYHVPHKVDLKFKVNQDKNLKLLKKSLSRKFENNYLKTIEIECEKSLVLSKNPFCSHYKLNLILGRYEFFDISTIKNWEEVWTFFKENSFTQIVFPNPYGNNLLLELYNYCRANNVTYIISERGAFPNSIYHDKNGFLFDSNSYDCNKWDYPLSIEQKLLTKEYISTLGIGNETLESQPQKLTRELTQNKLGIDNINKKIILIILQTKNDTVIQYFGRSFSTQESLKNFLEKIIISFKDNYQFVYKNHPLESSVIRIDGAINADNFHINNLIEICEAVVTINSGAGLIAALQGKPVFTLGNCWYSLNGIACSIEDEYDLLEKLKTFNPIDEKLLRFAYYLRFNFYSFGKQHTVLHRKGDIQINATTKIDYTEVQTFNHGRVFFKDAEYKVGFDSILFKEYELDSFILKNTIKQKILNIIQNNKKLAKLIREPEFFFKDSHIGVFKIIGNLIW